MVFSRSVLLIFLVFCWLLIAVAGSNLALKRNRNYILWFINCFLTGLISLLVVACSSALMNDEEIDYKETDILGWAVFFMSLILIGLSFWCGYLEA